MKNSRAAIAFALLACLPIVVTCSDDDPGSGSSNAGRSGTGATGAAGGASGGSAGSGANLGNGGVGGSTSGSGGADANAGASGRGAGGSSGMVGAAGASGAAGATGASGTTGASGAAGTGVGGTGGTSGSSGDGGPPPPTDGGKSIYSVQCRNESRPCLPGYCLGIQLPDGGNGFTCSNDCQTAAQCSTAPSGAEAQAGCVQFTSRSRCVLICENSGTRYSCPAGMACYTYPGAQVGYCLWP
jgi:hypothetical protein